MKYLKTPSHPLGKIVILFFLWCCLTFAVSAQSIYEQIGRLPVTIYTTEEYRGHAAVWAVTQSDEGLMYFGDSDGLYEYDGVSWRSVFDRNSFSGVRAFVKDSKGTIFYAGVDFGYLTTNEKGEKEAVSLIHLIPEEIRYGISFFFLNISDGYLWLQSREQLIRIELADDFSLKSFKSWSAETSFTYMFVQGDGIFIFQRERGLFQIVDEALKLVQGTEILEKDGFRIMLPYPGEGGEQFLLGGFTTGFYIFDGTTVSKFPTQVDQLIEEGAGLLYHALSYQGNFILSINGAGIVVMSPKGEILKKIGSDQGLPSDVVYGLYMDNCKGLWATTEDGMARISIDSPILSYGKNLGINSTVLSIQKKKEKLYLGTNTGLLKFDQKDNQFRAVPQIANAQIFNLWADGEDLIISGNKLQIIREEKAITVDFPKDGGRPYSTIIPGNNTNLLLVGTTTGLLFYERGHSKEFPWEYKGNVPGVDEGYYFFEDKEGTIFLIAYEKFYRLETDAEKLESIGTQSIKVHVFELENSDSFSFVDGELYISSPQGMQKYSSSEGKLIPTEDFRTVEKDLIDFNQFKTGILWFVSFDNNKYILKRNAEGKFVKDDRPNSIAPYLSEVDFIDEDSILWFGSPKGLIRYDPKKDDQSDKEFFTLIRRIETKTDTLPLSQNGRNKNMAPIEMKDDSYRFEFAAPYFEEEKKTKYQTCLEGFDPKWVDWNDNKFKEYTNLPAGSYTFRVRALAHTGRISEEAVFSFEVLPPWYATWWAYLIYTLLIGGLITIIVKWRSRKLKAENLILEERVNERTAELEKSLTNLKSTQAQLIQSEKMASLGELTAGIAHEIQNPLNFVNNFSELSNELVEELKSEQTKGKSERDEALENEILNDISQNLLKINHHGKRAADIVKGMLQHSRTSNGQKEPTDINALCDEYLRLAYHGLRAKDKSFNADFKTDFDPNLPIINVVPQDIGRVLLNLINNAFYAVNDKVKFNVNDYKPMVVVTTELTDNFVEIKVQDNGNGIPELVKDKIFQPFFTTKPAGHGTGLGLSLSYDIVKTHGGEIKISSAEGKGTEFKINLPVN